MVSKNTTLISVSKSTKENLDKLKLHPSLSYNDVIVGLIDKHNQNNSVEAIVGENPKSGDFTEDKEVPSLQQEPSIEVDETTSLDEVAEHNREIKEKIEWLEKQLKQI